MNYTTAINSVTKYIEDNLEEKLELKKLAKVANISPYHFHRIFLKETGDKVNDYIIKRRLTEASFDLIETEEPIIDISLKYGFNSPQSFARSFKNLYNLTPKEYRKANILNLDLVKTQIKHKSEGELKYKIIEKKEFILTGYEITSIYYYHKMTDINFLFQKINHALQNKELRPIENCLYLKFHGNKSFLGVKIDPSNEISKDMVTKTIPAKKYITFCHKGPLDKMDRTFDTIYNKCLPSIKNIQVDHSFILELFDEKHHGYYFTYEKAQDYDNYKIRDEIGFQDSFYFDILMPLKE